MSDRVYLAIDLKSFYASVECIERGLDPMTIIWLLRTKAVLRKPFVWQYLRL